MSDINIPGVTSSGIDTDQMVKTLMDAERIPVTRMEDRVTTYEEEKAAWQEVGRRISNLQDSAALLFGFENPFGDRVATSSDERVLVATAERNATQGVSRVTVEQLADADRFISRSLPTDYRVAAGRYGFRVGENEEHFTFVGGTLEAFAQAVNQRAGDVVNARVVRNTANTKVILIEAKQTGSENVLSFLDDARAFALEAGILEEVRDQVVSAPIQASTVSGTTGAATRTIQAGTLTVAPNGQATVKMPSSIPVTDSLVLEFEVNVHNTYTGYTAPEAPPGPTVPDVGGVTLGGVTVENAPSSVTLPQWETPEPPAVHDDAQMLFLRSSGTAVALPDLADTDGFTKVQFKLSDYVTSVDALEVRNNNTYRDISIRNVTVYDSRSRGDVAPVNPIGTARDAIVGIEGINVVRPSNTITDLVDGVTLNLKGTSNTPTEIDVEPDRENVTNSLIQFVFYYNELAREINVLTRNDPAVIDELTNLSDDERKQAEADLGRLQGDMTLNSLKSRMQTIMMNAYKTDAGSALSLLAQIGISTNESGPGSGFDASRLRGYLEMNPKDVDAALQTEFSAVRQLFGNDTNNDRAVDSGIAYELDRNLRPYVQVGGLIATRTGNIASSIQNTQDRIDRENQRLDEVEAQYKADFAQMQTALANMKDNQQALSNLSTQSGN